MSPGHPSPDPTRDNQRNGLVGNPAIQVHENTDVIMQIETSPSKHTASYLVRQKRIEEKA